MKQMRFLKPIVGAFLQLASVAAFAGEVPFNQASFQQTILSGQPAIVYLHATWCPTCRIQKPIVDRLSAEPELKKVTIFIADFDSETNLKKALKVTQQSTFVVFKNGHEVARSTGQTEEAVIRAVFEKAL
ncbi:thioredoxin family protein [Paraburkholderia silvatlantica]|uniref:thioredoxin family protein n=1 Tax=Paraburkholderia silvatlantica TaxID=321895 RepID=UPI003751AFBC